MASAYKMAYIVNELDSSELDDEIEELVKKRAKILRRQVAAEAPTRTGAYKRNWDIKQTEVKKEYGVDIKETLYNIDRYMLTHLLAYPHKNKWGTGTVPAVSDFATIVKRNINAHKKDISNIEVSDYIKTKRI